MKKKGVNLTGSWTLKINQKVRKQKLAYSTTLSLKQVGNQVTGVLLYDLNKLKYKFKSGLKKLPRLEIQVQGSIEKGYLHMTYQNTDTKIQQFGSFFLEIKSAKNLRGYFIGYGPESGGLVRGSIRGRRS